MADNPPAPNPGPRPPLPSSGMTGRLKSPTTQLPVKKGGAGKIVVMLSSVAKPPPINTQALPRVANPANPTPKPPPPVAPPAAAGPPPLPPKQVKPATATPTSPPRLSTTTYVKLPPKTNVPTWSSLSGKPLTPPVVKVPPASQKAPPPLPVKGPELIPTIRMEPKKPGAQHIPPIKLNEPSIQADFSGESIFLRPEGPTPPPKPDVPKTPDPAPPGSPTGGLQSLEAFERSQAAPGTPAPATPPPVAKDKPLVAPPLLPPQRAVIPPSALVTAPMGRKSPVPSTLPPTVAKTPETSAPLPPAFHVAPPMLEKAPELPQEKLPQPLPIPVAKTPESSAPLPALQVAPPMLEKAPELPQEKLPQPLPIPVAKTPETSAPPPALQIAPPMLEKTPELPAEKLRQPHLPLEARKIETPPDLPAAPVVLKDPAANQPAPPPPKPQQPPTLPAAKKSGNWLKKLVPQKKSTPVVVSSSSPKAQTTKMAEVKPALKPPVLPSRSLLTPQGTAPPPPAEKPKAPEPVKTPEKSDASVSEVKSDTVLAATPVPQKIETPPAAPLPEKPKPPTGELEKPAAKIAPAQLLPEALMTTKKKAPLPPTRAERSKKRRFMGAVIYWVVIFPLTIAALFIGSLHFGRDTRVEGQVIPPPGLPLNNEVWIVNDFRELSSGITEDLAAERTPLLQEIQERRDHVQRAQADVASREERIRLLQDQSDAAKADIDTLIKQTRAATQQVWDVEGAEVDAEYASRLDQLQKEIADRAKSLNLKYQPDDSFQSPEVWANAYRLALYEVPAGVDTVKEHQWLGDLMKQWRDYLKTLDDRKEQLREKAEQIRLSPVSKITDLNAKVEDLQQRIDGTVAEEAPIKAELQQAQADLASAQAEEAGLDDKYYKQLDVLPEEAIVNHIRIHVAANGRFTWVDDGVFAQGENEHSYWIFSRATRSDGRQYWALYRFSVQQNKTTELTIEPTGFISTKAILRPDLSPEEQEQ